MPRFTSHRRPSYRLGPFAMPRFLIVCFAGASLLTMPASFAEGGEGSAKSPDAYVALANAAYHSGDPSTCSEMFGKALDAGLDGFLGPFNGACCAALAGDPETAFQRLGILVERGYRQVASLEGDEDLNSLRDDPRWKEIVARVQANRDAFVESVHGELLELYEADQADRSGDMRNFDWAAISARDEARRQRVFELIEEGAPKVGSDYFHAAMVLQHGNEPDHYKKAHELAKKAAELDPTLDTAKWLSAAAWDRYLWNTDQPQIYGTQYSRPNGGAWTMEPFDREAVTDDERRALNVPVLADAEKRLESMNAQLEKQQEEAAKAEASADEAHEEPHAGQRLPSEQ